MKTLPLAMFALLFASFLSCPAPLLAASEETSMAGLQCGINNIARRWFEPVPADGSSAKTATENAHTACNARKAEAMADINAYIASINCPENCPTKRFKSNIEFQCNPGGTFATCDPSQPDRMKRFCRPFVSAGISIDACLNYICSLANSPSPYVAFTELVGKVSGFITCG
jgi:hypothetical protein